MNSKLTVREQQLEQMRMHDLRLTLAQLLNRETATAKVILDCLYDIGSIHLINQKVSHAHLNRLMKQIARFSKPVFRPLALRWVQKNGVQMLSDILYNQATFQTQPQPLRPIVVIDDQRSLPPSTEEVRRLRSQVNRLAGIAIATTAAFTGTIVLTSYRLQTNPVQFLFSDPAQTQATTPFQPK